MNIVIIDDEKLAIDVLSIMLKKLTQFSICMKGAFTNAVDAFALLKRSKLTLFF